jgi:ribosomal protein S18 acetylase RimI-like enzyme
MKSIRVRTLASLGRDDVARLVDGYTSKERYVVEKSESRGRTTITLRRMRLRKPFHKDFPRPASDLRRYRGVVRLGWSVGAYNGESLVGIAIAEPRSWNRSLWVWEIGVAATLRQKGIGRRMVHELARRARAAGFRELVCETQTTNVPAIDFYRKMGFTLEGVDLTYYTNDDVSKGEVAIFMKKALHPGARPAGLRPQARHTSK